MRTLPGRTLLLLLLFPVTALADIAVRVPVVTQVQGAALFRTSLTVANGSGGHSADIVLRLSYRSLVDGTFQNVTLSEGSLLPHRTLFFEDIVQHFKDEGSIRSQDRTANLFGTLLVTFVASGQQLEDSIAEARTYSAANGGGTNGIAYIGRNASTAGSDTIKGAVRNGAFGADGTTRANIGFVNEGTVVTDVEITYYDGATGATLKDFVQSSLSVGEVVQLNNIFADSAVPPGTRSIVVRAQAVAGNGRISGYGVQLDSVTQDASFFLMVEENQCGGGYVPPG